jgi:acyl-CoA reductase-like NAD-dependent aldehyde dehydrogenase
MGPLATQAQLDNIDSTVADAKVNGATLVHGGKQPAGI